MQTLRILLLLLTGWLSSHDAEARVIFRKMFSPDQFVGIWKDTTSNRTITINKDGSWNSINPAENGSWSLRRNELHWDLSHKEQKHVMDYVVTEVLKNKFTVVRPDGQAIVYTRVLTPPESSTWTMSGTIRIQANSQWHTIELNAEIDTSIDIPARFNHALAHTNLTDDDGLLLSEVIRQRTFIKIDKPDLWQPWVGSGPQSGGISTTSLKLGVSKNNSKPDTQAVTGKTTLSSWGTMANRSGPNSWSNSWDATISGELSTREHELESTTLTLDGPIKGHFFNGKTQVRDPYKGHLTLILTPTVLSTSDQRTITELSRSLANDSYAIRREAFTKARALPATVRNALKNRLKQSNDPELLYVASELGKIPSPVRAPKGAHLNWFMKELSPE